MVTNMVGTAELGWGPDGPLDTGVGIFRCQLMFSYMLVFSCYLHDELAAYLESNIGCASHLHPNLFYHPNIYPNPTPSSRYH